MAGWNDESANTRRWTEWIWAGEAAEVGVRRWLADTGLEAEWFDHYAVADFRVGGVRMELKTRAVGGDWKPRHHVLVPHQHRTRLTKGGYFFAAVERASNHPTLLLLGAISCKRFDASSVTVAVGERLDGGDGAPAQNACRELAVSALTLPGDWLAALGLESNRWQQCLSGCAECGAADALLAAAMVGKNILLCKRCWWGYALAAHAPRTTKGPRPLGAGPGS